MALGGLAQNSAMLFGARALQGAFAAIMAPAALSLLTVAFTEPKERARAFAVYGGIAGGGAAIGLPSVAEINEGGRGVIGTPDEAIAQVQRLRDQSGGFGAYLILTHDWADPDATNHSFELFARHVMPEFQGALESLRRSRAASSARFSELSGAQSAAIDAAQ